MSINKIHINNTTNLSLNDRFTVMQSVGPKTPAPTTRKVTSRRRTQSTSILDTRGPGVSLANHKFLEMLDKKHKMRAALKLKRKSMKAVLPNRPRIRNRIGFRKGSAASALRLTASGKLARSNSLTNIATMKADLVQTGGLRRSNSTSSLAGRLGARRTSIGNGPSGPRRRIKRNNIVRANSKQNLTRSNSTASLNRSSSRLSIKRSNSQLSLKRSNSRVSLRRSHSKTNLRTASNSRRGVPQRRIARNGVRAADARRGGGQRRSGQRRSGQRRSNSVTSRLGVRKVPMARDRLRNLNMRGARARPSRGRGRGQIRTRRNSTAPISNRIENSNNLRQGRVARPRGRGGNNNIQRGRSRSRSRGGRTQQTGNRGNRSSSRGRRRGRGRGKDGRTDIKKEVLDKEIDQYMAKTRSAFDDIDML